jgi:hypothetical protein
MGADKTSTGSRERVWVEKVDKDAAVPTAERVCYENGVEVERLTDLPVCPACLFNECVCKE